MHFCCNRLLRVTRAVALCRHVHSQQTVHQAIQEIRKVLMRQSSLPAATSISKSAYNDAKVLVANALVPRLSFSNDTFIHSQRKLTEQEAGQLQEFLQQRVNNEPLAYIIGRKDFWSMEFCVTRDTLIPRSDSEVLIETLVELFHPMTPLRILDIGTGTGCLLLSALSEFPHATGIGIDICPRALDVASKNARIHNLDSRTDFLLRDLQTLSGLCSDDKMMYQRFDVILCNPPYIPHRELRLVGRDVLEYEPHIALFPDGGPTCILDTGTDPDGLQMYQWLHESAANLFESHAECAVRRSESSSMHEQMVKDDTIRNCLLMEVGSEGQARLVRHLFTKQAMTQSRGSTIENEHLLQFKRFLYDASEKCRGLCFIAH